MSYHVFVKVKMLAVDAGRFVREFGKEYGDRIENARKVKTAGAGLWFATAFPAIGGRGERA